MKKFKLAVVIGRFQPFHNMHEYLVKMADKIADNTLVLIGSSMQAPTPKNPFSFLQRRRMIAGVFPAVMIEPIIDYLYDDNKWLEQIQTIVNDTCDKLNITTSEIVLVGHSKDDSSYYLKLFPKWEYHEIHSYDLLNATDIRENLFNLSHVDGASFDYMADHLPASVLSSIMQYTGTKEYSNMRDEFIIINKYKKSWEAAPYPPTFVTCDAVVVCSGHVLMVTRKDSPGKGLLALPGGFLDGKERVVDGILRELAEETQISLHSNLLRGMIREIKFFDHPSRSARGRTVTHAAYIPLTFAKLPDVSGADDAEYAHWISFADLKANRHRVFEDHCDIISSLTGVSI